MAAIPRPFAILAGGTSVAGPSAGGSTDNAIARWDGTTGRLLQNSAVFVSDTPSLEVYNTGNPAAANFEKFDISWSGNSLFLANRAGGTGFNRPLVLATLNANPSTVSSFTLSTSMMFSVINTNLTQTWFAFSNNTSGSSSGQSIFMGITPTWNNSGTSAATDLLINRTQTAVGSGAQYLIDAQTGGNSQFRITNNGAATISGLLHLNGTGSLSNSRFRIEGNGFSVGAWGLNGIISRFDAATWTDSSTAGSGVAASAVFSSFAQPTLAATNTLVITTDAANVYIADAPAAGTNMTIGNGWALWVDNGAVRIDETLWTSFGVAAPAGGSTNARIRISNTSGFGIYFGSGAPTVSAGQGSIYLRTDGSSTSTRLYVNTNGSTTWTNVTTAA